MSTKLPRVFSMRQLYERCTVDSDLRTRWQELVIATLQNLGSEHLAIAPILLHRKAVEWECAYYGLDRYMMVLQSEYRMTCEEALRHVLDEINHLRNSV